MKLLIDAGNRRLKWATAVGGAGAGGGDALDGRSGAFVLNADIADALTAQWAQLAKPERPASVWASCVARPEIRQAIADYARNAWSLEPVFITSPARQAGIVNGYPEPASLGSDRWAALVAAGNLFARQPVIVVDVGTAVTVDALDSTGLFRGGVIFPGVRGMRAALCEQTEIALSGDEDEDGGGGENENGDPAEALNATATATATTTRSAVAHGALLAVAGGVDLAIARQRNSLQTDHPDCQVLATGGDAAQIAPLLTAEVRIVPDLVLRGLATIAAEAAI